MKTKVPLEEAQEVACELLEALEPCCERIEIAGSIRRKKPMVGDIEVLYVPQNRPGERVDLFAETPVVAAIDLVLNLLLVRGVLTYRPTATAKRVWGPSNKFAVHARSGIGVDFFSTGEMSWWNYLVCRTGGATTNTQIASAANAKGWTWHPTADGFTRGHERHRVTSEEDVFSFVGLPYLQPWERP
jgi:DNA polymerase/3'-5' exonuclease PolX